ncbi:MAG: class I SAM-dependent methyltransferase [Pseudolabrys sp.]|nr:class I SAM-dependent methyltransferase [Pseudolabrys sp.]MDP2297924.1 class I SAM-dependent methyltransferase [Pseudolabrys sp.]
MSVYDAVAPQFDRHRALPDDAAVTVREAVLRALPPRPRLLDLGAGSGRIGWPFVAAHDDYVGVDLSFGMLQAFRQRERSAALAQADGCALPFADRGFDAVLLVQIFGGLKRWRALIDEALRVLRPRGALMLGRTRAPDDGIDARMKQRLDMILAGHALPAEAGNSRARAELHLEERAAAVREIDAAHWRVTRSPADFLQRHAGGARFSTLAPALRASALGQLADWAAATFGNLDTRLEETHRFTLRIFTFAER